MNMATWLEKVAHGEDSWLILMLSILLFSQVIDFLLGSGIAIFNSDETFSSSKLKLGLLVKVMQLALVIFVLVPLGIALGDVGTISIRVLLIGFIVSELYSILGHFKIVNDNSQWLETLETFINSITKK